MKDRVEGRGEIVQMIASAPGWKIVWCNGKVTEIDDVIMWSLDKLGNIDPVVFDPSMGALLNHTGDSQDSVARLIPPYTDIPSTVRELKSEYKRLYQDKKK